MGTIFAKLLQEHKWICHITSGEATSDMTYSRVLLQKLCKNCPHPEKPFSNSKTISQIKFPYRIEKLVKSQQEWPGGKTLCRSLVTCKGFFCPVVLLLLLCENGHFLGEFQILAAWSRAQKKHITEFTEFSVKLDHALTLYMLKKVFSHFLNIGSQ